MTGYRGYALAALTAALLCGCSGESTAPTNSGAEHSAVQPPDAEPVKAAARSPAAPAGFDPAAAPMGTAPGGKWPYFSLIDGYQAMSARNRPGESSLQFIRDVAFDRYEVFDGTRLIPVDGQTYTVRALGNGASFHQVRKTYERLVQGLGGVTVWEGSGKQLVDAGLRFSDSRQRGLYMLDKESGGTYFVRTPTSELWIELWKRWQDEDDSYWLTIVEKKALEIKARLLDADQMKAALDARGRVALYVNFDTDAASLKPDAQPILAEIVKLLTANPGLKLEVQGHTDNQGTAARNLQLSTDRANAVFGALLAAGIGADRLTAKGYGQTQPLADNATEDGKAQNRRVELVKR